MFRHKTQNCYNFRINTPISTLHSHYNIRLDWFILDSELQVMIVGGAQILACGNCGTSGLITSLCLIPFTSAMPVPPPQLQLQPQPSSSGRPDSRGSHVLIHTNVPICNNFNENVCTYPNCVFFICSSCQDAQP